MLFICYHRRQNIEKRLVSRGRVNRERGVYSTKAKMQFFVYALMAVIAVTAGNAQPVGETGGPLSSKVCEPGHTKMEDCNTCHCIADGSGYACTRMACPSLPVSPCEPGKTFKLYCNTCVCPPDGLREHAACTLMGCPGDWTFDGTLVSTVQPLVDPTPST